MNPLGLIASLADTVGSHTQLPPPRAATRYEVMCTAVSCPSSRSPPPWQSESLHGLVGVEELFIHGALMTLGHGQLEPHCVTAKNAMEEYLSEKERPLPADARKSR